MNLFDLLEEVTDRTSFLAFVRALAGDRRAGVDWQNDTISDYLEAAVSWAEDAEGLPEGLPDQGSWSALARLLYAGKIYE